MKKRLGRKAGMTVLEILVVLAVFGIFLGIAVPSVIKSFRSMGRAKQMTSRYPDARRALENVSVMLRRTYPPAMKSGGTFIGRNGSYEAGGIKFPFDELSFPALDTGYAHAGSVQKITYRLEMNPENETSPAGLVQRRSPLDGPADAGTIETLLSRAMGLDFRYLDDSTEPPEWVQQWPPAPVRQAAAPAGSAFSAESILGAPEGGRQPASTEGGTSDVRLPKAVEVTVFVLGGISPQPTSFTAVVNLPSE